MRQKRQITPEDIIVYDDDIIVNEIDEEIIMMSIKRDKYYGLDAVGSEIWKKLYRPHKIKDIIELMQAEYDAEEDIIERDIIKFLHELLKEGMIRVVS